jgi:hypothetical protein
MSQVLPTSHEYYEHQHRNNMCYKITKQVLMQLGYSEEKAQTLALDRDMERQETKADAIAVALHKTLNVEIMRNDSFKRK